MVADALTGRWNYGRPVSAIVLPRIRISLLLRYIPSFDGPTSRKSHLICTACNNTMQRIK